MITYPPTLFDAYELGAAGQALVEEHADDAWLTAAALHISRLESGTLFIAEDVVIAIEAQGYTTSNRKAIGPVVNRAHRDGLIYRYGARPARTSHGSLKPEWRRL